MEQLAYWWWGMPNGITTVVGFAAWPLGGLIGWYTANPTEERMARLPFFLWINAMFLFAAIASAILVRMHVPAIVGGYSWLALLINVFAIWMTLGFAHARLAMARSRDARGDARLTFLIFIPVANFYLILVPSRDGQPVSAFSAGKWVGTAFGILGGLILEVAAIGTTQATNENFQKALVNFAEQPPRTTAALQWHINLLISNWDLPMELNQHSTVVDAQINDTILLNTYQISNRVSVVEGDIRSGNCLGYSLFGEAGLTIVDRFYRGDDFVGEVTTEIARCASVAES